MTLLLRLVLLCLCLPTLVHSTVYWATPNGDHDISGNLSFCQFIRSIDSSHVGQTRAFAPSTFGTIGAAVACAKVAGDVVNISGINGIYNDTSSDRHTINTTTVTPSFGLASGTVGNPTIVQGVPGDPKPEWRVRNGAAQFQTYTTAPRHYITVRNLKLNGINSTQHTNFQTNCMYLFGTNLIVEDNDIYNCGGMGVSSHSAPNTPDCLANHHHTFRRNRIFDVYSTTLGAGDGYAIYSSANDQIIEDNEIFRVESEFLQIYDSGGCDTARPIIRNNYLHDLKKGTSGSANAGKCGPGIAVNGSEGQIYNNIIFADCPSDTGIGFQQGIGTGIGACPTLGFPPGGRTGRTHIWNNFIYAPLAFGIQVQNCVATAGSEIKNNVVLANTAIGGPAIGGTIQQTNRTTGVFGDCFDATFHLKTGTNPCVNAGTPVPQVTVDFEGTTRPQPPGGLYDIGHDELGGVIDLPPAPPTGLTVT